MAELHVFNRWGQQVALVLGRNAVWDGRSGTGLELPEGIYYYTVRGESRTAGTYRRSGYVQLLR
jgi:hypothetical protein